MKVKSFAHALVACSVVVLTACGSSKPAAPAAKATPELPELMAQGAAAERDGMKAAALSRYEEATQLYPTSKAPWLKIARIQFDSSNYGEAIVAAQQVVARDESDEMARSILSVSGLRIATKAVADLTKNRAMTGSVRTEAQELASVLRESLGENVLVPAATPAGGANKSRTSGATAPNPSTSSSTSTRASSNTTAPANSAPPAGTGSPFSSLR